jgi:hypothetical protein
MWCCPKQCSDFNKLDKNSKLKHVLQIFYPYFESGVSKKVQIRAKNTYEKLQSGLRL